MVESKKPRGGVVIYKKKSTQIQIDIICNEFRDCVVVQIRNTNMVLACMYIPPENSKYYDDIYFDNLQMLLNHFNDRYLLIAGDLNSRFGNLISQSQNPDKTTNKHGKT